MVAFTFFINHGFGIIMSKSVIALGMTFIAALSAFSYAESGRAWQPSSLPSVQSIKVKKNGNIKVKCTDGTKGTVSSEDIDICIFSKKKKLNECKTEGDWSIDDAIVLVCNA